VDTGFELELGYAAAFEFAPSGNDLLILIQKINLSVFDDLEYHFRMDVFEGVACDCDASLKVQPGRTDCVGLWGYGLDNSARLAKTINL
tara:strand:+ start:195 stop:461 length:267 start_codon:yes stop_codon:yes gene_type:complete